MSACSCLVLAVVVSLFVIWRKGRLWFLHGGFCYARHLNLPQIYRIPGNLFKADVSTISNYHQVYYFYCQIMSQENAGNSWYKFLESLQVIETLTDTSLNRKKVLLAKLSQNNSYPEIKLFLLSYECIMCTRHILEVREDDMCEHQCCETCAPRIHCNENCLPWFIYELSANDLESQQEIIDQFKPETGIKIVKVGSKKKRKNPEDDEMRLVNHILI